jgi:Holliday junction resolvase RusA-like endonuclease
VFTPDKTRQAESAVAMAWWAPPIPIEIPVEVRLTAHYGRPASHFLKDGGLSAAGRRALVPMKRPDLDNVVKLVLDALNGVAYADDSQVLRFTADRVWASAAQGPGVLVSVRPAPLPGSPSS